MPLSIRALRDSTRPLEIRWTTVDETTSLRYRAMQHQDAYNRLLQAYADNKDGVPALNIAANIHYVCEVVAEWDFLAADGKRPVPLTEEALKDFPTSVVLGVINAITEDMNVHPLRALPSPSGLS